MKKQSCILKCMANALLIAVGIVPMALLRRPRPMRTEAVAVARNNARHMPMPDIAGALGQADPPLPVGSVEQAELDGGRIGRDYRDVGTGGVERDAERLRPGDAQAASSRYSAA